MTLQVAWRCRIQHLAFKRRQQAAVLLQRRLRVFLATFVRGGRSKSKLWLEAQALRRELQNLARRRETVEDGTAHVGDAQPEQPGTPHRTVRPSQSLPFPPSSGQDAHATRGYAGARDGQVGGAEPETSGRDDALIAMRAQLDATHRETARQRLATRQLEGGFSKLASAAAIFRIEGFLEATAPVLESHVFSSGGFTWKLWVKPRSGPSNESVGIYLAPSVDMDEVHTADFELAIVGPNGSVCALELAGGRARLHKATAAHGFPNFISRSEISRGEAPMLHNGCLIVTASKIANVRLREEA